MSVGKSVCKTGFCNFTSSYSSSHSSILVFQKGEMGGGGGGGGGFGGGVGVLGVSKIYLKMGDVGFCGLANGRLEPP